MASAAAKRGKNEPEPRPIIVKKIVAAAHGGHHGGAWKVAYADFVTAMMAFFLLLWILGATTEKQRKGIADYFTPTLIEMRQKTAGANGPFGGDSIISKDSYSHRATQTGNRTLTIPKASGGAQVSNQAEKVKDRMRFGFLKQALMKRIMADKSLQRFVQNIRFTDTREGLRIDLVDKAEFSMFAVGTDRLLPQAWALMGEVAKVAAAVPNGVIVRGHTDALPYAAGRTVNNWTLSSGRAEATRRALAEQGVAPNRFVRIEGVADREPFIPSDRYDPRNRRMSITLAWSGAPEPTGVAAAESPAPAGVEHY